MDNEILRFRGLTINKERFEEKYGITLSDTEWKVVISNATRSYEEDLNEYKLLVSRHIRKALHEIGYKATLEGTELKYKRGEE